MYFALEHTNLNVTNLEKSIQFYNKALGLNELRRIEAPDGSFILVFLSDSRKEYLLELTWLKSHPEKYDLGENETHIAFTVDDMEAAHAMHQQMGCICFENKEMGIYFISDPDGYWFEIIPKNK